MPPDPARLRQLASWYTPTQIQEHRKRMYGVIEKDDFSILLISRHHVGYFDLPKTCEYKHDSEVFLFPEYGYDQKSKRCDRLSERIARKGIHAEESNRIIPLLTSSIYGKRKTDLEGRPVATYNRSVVTKEFKRRNKINLKPDEGLPIKCDKFF